MREILFRGKRAVNGEWVYGSLVGNMTGCVPIIVRHANMEDDCSLDFDYTHVNASTVGQYTGLTDKNGVKIFEGDLIEYGGSFFEVKYIDGFAAFDLRSVDNMSLAPRITSNTVPRMKAIGNIYDTPELLKGGGEG